MHPVNSQLIHSNYLPSYQPRGLLSSLTISTINISKAAFYLLKLVFSIIKKKTNQRLELLMHYHLCKSSSITAWYIFGKTLIYPSINIEKKDSLIKPIRKEKFDKIFQKANLLSPAKLRYKKRTSGVCLGASMNFIKMYLRAEQAGLKPKEAFGLTASKHSNGITEKACIKQGIPPNVTYSSFASLFKLKYIFCMEEFPIDNQKNLTEKLNQLPFGAYQVSMASIDKEKTKHSIVIIKNEEAFMVYDPNYGSAYSINNNAKVIQKLTNNYDYNLLHFTQLNLK